MRAARSCLTTLLDVESCDLSPPKLGCLWPRLGWGEELGCFLLGSSFTMVQHHDCRFASICRLHQGRALSATVWRKWLRLTLGSLRSPWGFWGIPRRVLLGISGGGLLGPVGLHVACLPHLHSASGGVGTCMQFAAVGPTPTAGASEVEALQPGKIREMEPTTQRALELHMCGKWAERLLAHFAPFAEHIAYMQDILGGRTSARKHWTSWGIAGSGRSGNTAWYTRVSGFTVIPWQVRSLLNQLADEEVTPCKLRQVWNTQGGHLGPGGGGRLRSPAGGSGQEQTRGAGRFHPGVRPVPGGLQRSLQ